MLVAEGILPFIYTLEYSFLLLVFSMAYGLQNKMLGFVQKQIETVSAQEKLIQTIEGVQKDIPGVIKELREVSQSMASQAAQHASMAEQLSSSVSLVRSTTDETAQAAAETLKIAERTRGFSNTSTEWIRSVEKGFEETKPIMDNLENDIEELTEKISSTEDILEFIRQMANQIKILAVNAAIQAAKAGEYGVGFRVVANELRSMIGSIEDYLVNSRSLLESIRNKASESTSMTQESNRLLARQLSDLNQASTFITNIQDAFGDTSQRVGIIANASQKQHIAIAEVVTSIDHLTEAANKLSNSADTVLRGIEKMMETEKAFDDILKNRSI
jgi:methyl-accepting chemotaxis protein